MKNSVQIKSRNEIEPQYKWKTEDLYPSDEDWTKEYNALEQKIPSILSYKDNITLDNLWECLSLRNELSHQAERLYVYANLRAHEDSTNSFYQGLADKADSIIVSYESAVSFIEPAILNLDENALLHRLSSNSSLKVYTHYISDILHSKEHILTADKEELLAQVYDLAVAPENIYSMLNNADMTFPDALDSNGNTHTLTHGKYISYLESSDRELRKSAFNNYYDTYYKQQNTIAAIYNSSVKKDVFNARVRNYKSSLAASLFATNIPTEVYTNLIDTVNAHLPLMHRYVALRKKLLGLDDLNMYDLYTPIVPNIDRTKTYDDAKNTVIEALKPLGEDYLNTLKSGFENGWIDIYENKGKRSGAYAWGTYGTHPYVSLNYDDTVNSMFTLAHEMGHAMHSHYTWSNQPYLYGDYTIFVAEVASTVNEALLMEHLLNTTTDINQKKYLINYFMEQFRGTLFRQTMFAEFELITHHMAENGEPLTFDSLSQKYMDLNKKYFGTDINIDYKISWEWARIPHFYTAFYVYQYATGYSAAIALSQNILHNNGTENYLSFLKSGSSDYSINLLKLAGVDMTTTEPITNAMKVFESLLEQMEQLAL